MLRKIFTGILKYLKVRHLPVVTTVRLVIIDQLIEQLHKDHPGVILSLYDQGMLLGMYVTVEYDVTDKEVVRVNTHTPSGKIVRSGPGHLTNTRVVDHCGKFTPSPSVKRLLDKIDSSLNSYVIAIHEAGCATITPSELIDHYINSDWIDIDSLRIYSDLTQSIHFVKTNQKWTCVVTETDGRRIELTIDKHSIISFEDCKFILRYIDLVED